MTLLRSDLLATGGYTLRATGIAMTAGAIALAALPRRTPRTPVPMPELAVLAATSNVAVRAAARESPAPPPPAPLPHAELAFVFRAGGTTYMKLDDLDPDQLPAHGKARVVKDDYIDAAIAPARDVPDATRRWLGRKVVVDGECTAKVTGFAIVARVDGDPDWAGVKAKTWTAASLFEHGTLVLAAALDGCDGVYARDAKLPPIVLPETRDAPALAAKAKAALRDSEVGRYADREWHDSWGQRDHWWDNKDIDFGAEVLRHPKTGEVWISVRAYKQHGCGDPYVDLWGLYRVARDGSLQLVAERRLEDGDILKLLDLDGDGKFDTVLGREWLGGLQLQTIDGAVLESLDVQFYGCPC